VAGQRYPWRVATVAEAHGQTASSRTIVFDTPGWPGHLAGQHVDMRLTAEDGYSTQRSYSIAAPADGDRVALTVQRGPGGEVSPYLVDEARPGDQVELRGPVGGWFVWRPDDPARLQLIAGGSGVVPLMAIVREHAAVRSTAPLRLIYSVRSPADVLYRDEIGARTDTTVLYTRSAPAGVARTPGRIDTRDLLDFGWPPGPGVETYVCGPTGFVEAVAGKLILRGHDPAHIRTERFG
jgi:ferredoxin-NADP reductase